MVPAERTSRALRELGAGTAFTDDHIDRLRNALSTQYVVVGSFATSGEPAARRVRIDVRVMRPDGDPLAVSGSGSDAELFTLMASAGRDLRERLGLERTTEAATQASRAAFPANIDATRLYAEGLARLRELDAVRAQELLEKAASLEPSNPMIHMALASAWTALGYDRRATESAQRAFDASKGLGREVKLNVEGNLYSALRDWPKAIEVYRTLSGFFADNVEYGLRLAEAQTAGGKHKDALATLETVRASMPQPDPRLDIVESMAASALSDYPRELASIQRARQHADAHGMRLLSARAYLFEGRGYFNQGKITEAEPALEKARELFAAGGDKSGEAAALNSLATVMSDRDDATLGQKMYEESLAASTSIGDRRGMSSALNNLGILLKDSGKYDEARKAHERSLALRREIADRNWIAISLNNIGVVLFEQDQFREASKYYKESLDLARELGDKRSQVRALHNLAIVEREAGNLAAARKEIEESLVMRDGDWRQTRADRSPRRARHEPAGTRRTGPRPAEPGRGDQTLGRDQAGARRGARALSARGHCAGGRRLCGSTQAARTRAAVAHHVEGTAHHRRKRSGAGEHRTGGGPPGRCRTHGRARRENFGRRQDADAGGGEIDRRPRPPGSQRRRRRRTAARRRPRPGRRRPSASACAASSRWSRRSSISCAAKWKRPGCSSMACARNFAAPAC